MRVTPRDVIDLMRIALLVTREDLVRFADEKRERLYLDRLKPEIVALRHEQ